MNNNVKMKNKDELLKNKLNIETNNKPIHNNKSNVIQIIKNREMNISNFDPIKYKRSLLNMQNPKKVVKNKEIKKGPYIKKNTFHFFGPYNKLINGGGGFCKRLHNKNYNLNIIYDLFSKNLPKYKQFTEKNEYELSNTSSYRNTMNNTRKERKINNIDNILIEENDNDFDYYNIIL